MNQNFTTPTLFFFQSPFPEPLAISIMQFKIEDDTFEDTFKIMTQAAFPIVGLVFFRKHSTVLETAQGPIDFPNTNHKGTHGRDAEL